MNIEIVETGDGSSTILQKLLNVTYHSIHGSVQESNHVFIKEGIEKLKDKTKITIIEFGFGSGLNALLSYKFAQLNQVEIQYFTFEKFPIEMEIYSQLEFGFNKEEFAIYLKMHESIWEKEIQLSPFFTFKKLNVDFMDCDFENSADIIFYDAFAPNVQPELWTQEMFSIVYKALKENGFMVTYCAKGQVKRDLRAVGFFVESCPGPLGKREMTKATKLPIC